MFYVKNLRSFPDFDSGWPFGKGAEPPGCRRRVRRRRPGQPPKRRRWRKERHHLTGTDGHFTTFDGPCQYVPCPSLTESSDPWITPATMPLTICS